MDGYEGLIPLLVSLLLKESSLNHNLQKMKKAMSHGSAGSLDDIVELLIIKEDFADEKAEEEEEDDDDDDDGDGVDQRRRRNRHVNDEIKSQKTMSSTALVTRLMALQSSLTYSISSKMRRCNDGVNQGLLHGRSSHEGNLYSRV